MNNNFNEIFEVMKSYENILIATHTSPDGDAVASATALSLGLKKIGIKSKIITEKIDEKYNIIPYDKVDLLIIDEIACEDLQCDLFISVDCGSKDRFVALYNLFDNAKATINLDHHQSNDYYADYNFVDVNSSSTAQIIFLFLEQFNLLDKDIAQSIDAGIIFDSGGFMYSKTSSVTFEIASKLLKFDIPHTEIYRRIIHSKTIDQNRATAFILSNMAITEDDIGCLAMNYEDFESNGIPVEGFDGSVVHLSNTLGINVCFTAFEKKKGITKVSLRAHNFDVNKVAAVFGGGGHTLAAGCALQMNARDAAKLIIEEIQKYER